MATRAKKTKATAKSAVKRAVTKVKTTAKKATARTSAKASAKKSAPKKAAVSKAKPAPQRAKPSLREQGMTVETFITKKVPAPWKAVMAELRMTVKTAVPEADECFKWGQPVYELNGPFAWMKPFRNHVDFGFWRGAELNDPHGILEGSGDRMKHVKITDPENVPIEELDHLIRQAAELNRQKGDPSKRR